MLSFGFDPGGARAVLLPSLAVWRSVVLVGKSPRATRAGPGRQDHPGLPDRKAQCNPCRFPVGSFGFPAKPTEPASASFAAASDGSGLPNPTQLCPFPPCVITLAPPSLVPCCIVSWTRPCARFGPATQIGPAILSGTKKHLFHRNPSSGESFAFSSTSRRS